MSDVAESKNVNLQTVNDPKEFKNRKKISTHDEKVEARFQRELKAACRSLQFVSETDADIIPFSAAAPSSGSLRSYLKTLEITSAEIEEVAFDNFFDRLTKEKDWFGPTEKDRAEQFAKLREVLETNLEKLRVIRVGKVQIDIYVVGLDANGRLAGVKTKAVET